MPSANLLHFFQVGLVRPSRLGFIGNLEGGLNSSHGVLSTEGQKADIESDLITLTLDGTRHLRDLHCLEVVINHGSMSS